MGQLASTYIKGSYANKILQNYLLGHPSATRVFYLKRVQVNIPKGQRSERTLFQIVLYTFED